MTLVTSGDGVTAKAGKAIMDGTEDEAAEPASARAVIARYRTQRGLSQAALGQRIGVSRSMVTRIEAGERALQPDILARIITALNIPPAEGAALLRQCGYADAALDTHAILQQQRVSHALLDAFRRSAPVRRLVDPPRYLTEWAWGRLAVAQYDAIRAVVALEEAVRLGTRTAEDEFFSILLIDYADALSLGGFLTRAEAVVRDRCLPLCAKLLKEAPAAPRAQMGMARSRVMQAANAYNRGDETACWDAHAQAIPHLMAAGDDCGWAKSLFFLALFRFWQGRLEEAETLARDALLHAEAIPLRTDYWWELRDALWLGRTWWQATTLALLLDILACQGNSDTEAFDRLVTDYEDSKPWWVRDFPPFASRYRWLSAVAGENPAETAATLAGWTAQTAAGGCWNLHADLTLVLGDFLRWAYPDDGARQARARRLYADVRTLATTRGFALHAASAARRLSDPAPPFPGLTVSRGRRTGR